jgi:hypothetical protein
VGSSVRDSSDANVSKEVFGERWLQWILQELQKASPMLTSDLKKKSGQSGMSESDEESAHLGAVPMLEYISRELNGAQEQVTKLIRSKARRQRGT